MSLTNSGTGLRVLTSPNGLKLASSPFTTQPDEKMAVVDVYTEEKPGVINSISATESNSGFLDTILNAVKSASAIASSAGLSSMQVPGLSSASQVAGLANMTNTTKASGVSAIASSSNSSSLSKLQSSIGSLGSMAQSASRAISAIALIKKGGVSGTVNGIAALGGAVGVTSNPKPGTSIYNANQRSDASSSARQTNSLNALASNVASLTRTASYMKSSTGTDTQSRLASADSALAIAASTIGTLDKASQSSFATGFSSVFSKTKTQEGVYNAAANSQVRSTMADYTLSYSDTSNQTPSPTACRAGTTVGLAMVGSGYGDNSIYSLARTSGMDDETAFIAGTALCTHGTKTGNLELLENIQSDPVGRRAVTANPYALSTTVYNLTPTTKQIKKPYAEVYDNLNAVGASVEQDWSKTLRANEVILDTTHVDQSLYATQVVHGKANNDNFKARTTTSSINATQATLTPAQMLSAACSRPIVTSQSLLENNPGMSISEARMLVEDNIG